MEAVDGHLSHVLVLPEGIVIACQVPGSELIAPHAEGDPGVAVGGVLELVSLAIVEVEFATCAVVLVKVDLESDWVLDTGEEGHAVLVEEDWKNAAASDENSLLKIRKGSHLPLACLCDLGLRVIVVPEATFW